MDSKNIVDLEDVVKTRAFTSYKRSRTFWQPRKLEDVKLEVDWSGVSFIPGKPKFTKNCEQNKTEQSNNVENDDITHHVDCAGDEENKSKSVEKNSSSSDTKADRKTTKRPITSIIFTSVFENKSKLQQTHSLKAERSTTATCKSSLTCGFTKGLNVGLTLACPKSVVKASIGYSEGFSLTGATESTEQKTLTWTIEGSLIVAPESKLKAQVHIIEKKEKYLFKTTVAIKGFVAVQISNRKNNKFMKTFTGDMQTIISETSKREKNLKIAKTEGDIVFVTISGECLFNFGIKQETVVSVERLHNQTGEKGDRDSSDRNDDESDAQEVEELSDKDSD